MKKIFIFVLFTLVSIGLANAAVRDDSSVTREKNSIQQTSAARSTTNQKTTGRSAIRKNAGNTNTRDDLYINNNKTSSARSATKSKNNTTRGTAARNTNEKSKSNITARVAIDEMNSTISETRTGSNYEQCKSAYFTCMDQFCTLKNDNYRRCSCSDRIYDLEDIKTVMEDANDKLTEFTESLDSVGMTAAQATAMKTSSEGENALTSDTSSSKALLQAIMSSIRGEDSTVSNSALSNLNSINISFDSANAFGSADSGQIIATYNGKNLYTAVYGQCRNAVKADCNDASLQRAVTAYLMAIEQDCNTVETSINETQKKMTSAVREGNAMLDLARVENRQEHNSDDMSTCMNNVEAAILSEEVCGTNYHKCLDNGEFININTGEPIAGVVKFYELENLLTFDDNSNISNQKLAKISNNRTFVNNFENRVKKFAEPSLDKCTENADDVWSDYLDKAMLDIYYAQKAKVTEVKEACFDYVSECYTNIDTTLTSSMSELTDNEIVLLQPDNINLNSALCKEYVQSCDNMFDGNILEQYVESRTDTDILTACRAVLQKCFDDFGGTNYENFYYPTSGLFDLGQAPSWFTLCNDTECDSYVSECAKELSKIESCSSKDMMERAFGGFDLITVDENDVPDTNGTPKYGILQSDNTLSERELRPTGVATEIYYQIIDTLSTQCNNLQGRFVQLQFLKQNMYTDEDNICLSHFTNGGCPVGEVCVSTTSKCNISTSTSCTPGEYYTLATLYGVADGEDMCPKSYTSSVDTKSWGACLCWENGARRSEFGTSTKCVAEIPTSGTDGVSCSLIPGAGFSNPPLSTSTSNWCVQGILSSDNQVCPFKAGGTSDGVCFWDNGTSTEYILNVDKIPEGIL